MVSTAQNAIDCKKFSEWRRLVCTLRHMYKGLSTTLSSKSERRTSRNSNGPLTCQELNKAETFWVIWAQQNVKDRHAKGKFKQLSPFVDARGVIIVGGRMDKVIVSYNMRHPVLLPYKHWISLLITRHIHE